MLGRWQGGGGWRRFGGRLRGASVSAVLVVASAILAYIVVSGSAAAPYPVPLLSLNATKATWGDQLILKIKRPPRSREAFRFYLVPSSTRIRSRFDPALVFIGAAAANRSTLRFTLPPLDAGRYRVAYWCRSCAARQDAVKMAASAIEVEPALVSSSCPATIANASTPPGAPAPPSGWYYVGNGALWALMPPSGVWRHVAATDGTIADKIQWLASAVGANPALRVEYRRLDTLSTWTSATVIGGSLAGYTGPSWASRMAFRAGCWQVTGRVRDVTLSFIIQIEPQSS